MTKVELFRERVRFAPAPSGSLHIGNARTALFNWIIAKKTKGSFILRIDDTSHKAEPEIVDSILKDLNWLGIYPDEGPYFQSSRIKRYREVVDSLLKEGVAYVCFCKEKPKGRCYRCLSKSPKEIVEGHPVRLKTGYKKREVKDLVFGRLYLSTEDDPIIWRSNGLPTYYLTSTIDDIDYGTTLIMRGEDLLSSTPYQIFIMEVLGVKLPKFAHLPLIFQPDGAKISKREGGYTIKEIREKGVLSEAVVNVMALSGWSPPTTKDRFTMDELIDMFSLDRVSKAQSSFDWGKMYAFHKDHLKQKGIEEIKERIKPFLNIEIDERQLEIIARVIQKEGWLFSEIDEIFSFLKLPTDRLEFDEVEKEILKEWLVSLKEAVEPSDQFKEIALSISEKLGKSKGKVIRTLRRALTHKKEGLGMDLVLSLLSKEEIIDRINRVLS